MKIIPSSKIVLTIIGLIAIIAVGLTVFDKIKQNAENQKIDSEYAIQKDIFIKNCLGTDQLSLSHERVFIRILDCVHKNSIHNISDEFRSTSKVGLHAFVDRMNTYTSSPDTVQRPHMECSSRSRVMGDILQHLGYDAREAVIAHDIKNYLDHVVIEVVNPDTQNAMMFDTSYNIYVKVLGSDKILNMREILETPLEDLTYCEPSGKCSPDTGTHRVGNRGVKLAHLPPYYGNVFLNAYDDDESARGPLLYNPERFDIEGTQLVNGEKMTYCEKRPDWCSVKGVEKIETKK